MGAVTTNFLNIEDPDAPVFRIYPLWFFQEALRLRQLVLVAPERWEDPYEILPSRIMIVHERTAPSEQRPLGPLRPAYAQCWSNTGESDTLLRAYSRVVKDSHFGRNTSPRDEGVRVRSSFGAVVYADGDQILQDLTNMIGQYGAEALAEGNLRASLLLRKRSAFQHEAEVRLIYIEGRNVPAASSVHVSINPNDVFDEVAFDPRLAEFERREREAVARSLGYNGTFANSELYTGQALLVMLDK